MNIIFKTSDINTQKKEKEREEEEGRRKVKIKNIIRK